MGALTQSTVESATLAWLKAIGWRIAHGPEIAPDQLLAERRDYGEVVLAQRLRDALARLNPDLPADALERILRKYGYPPDKQGKATRTVLEQAEVLCRDWAEKV
jgi:type I restriction enzyme R subunit